MQLSWRILRQFSGSPSYMSPSGKIAEISNFLRRTFIVLTFQMPKLVSWKQSPECSMTSLPILIDQALLSFSFVDGANMLWIHKLGLQLSASFILSSFTCGSLASESLYPNFFIPIKTAIYPWELRN